MGPEELVNDGSQVPLAMETATMQHIEEKESHLNSKVSDSMVFDSVVSSEWTVFLVAQIPLHLILVLE